MGWIGCVRCNKFWHDFVERNFALIAPVEYVLHHVTCSYEIIRNELKHCATHKNISLGSNGEDRVRSLRKITTWLRGTNFCINCTSSACFGVFHSVCVHLGSFHNCKKLGAKRGELVQLMQKFVPRSHVVMFWCIWDHFVTAWNLLQNILN